jgi:hypothetical protein
VVVSGEMPRSLVMESVASQPCAGYLEPFMIWAIGAATRRSPRTSRSECWARAGSRRRIAGSNEYRHRTHPARTSTAARRHLTHAILMQVFGLTREEVERAPRAGGHLAVRDARCDPERRLRRHLHRLPLRDVLAGAEMLAKMLVDAGAPRSMCRSTLVEAAGIAPICSGPAPGPKPGEKAATSPEVVRGATGGAPGQ